METIALFVIFITLGIFILKAISDGDTQSVSKPQTDSYSYTKPIEPHKFDIPKSEPKPTTQPKPITPPVNKDINYDNLPYSGELLVRFCRVENKEFICIDINKQDKTAVFRSRENPAERYFTTLNTCTCPDSEIPCKHMLHLANSLGYLDKWKKEIPTIKYNQIVKSYINSQYSTDPKGWKRNTFGNL